MREGTMQPWTTWDAAKRLGVTPERVRQLSREGKLVPMTTTAGGGIRLFDPAAVERLAREREGRA